MGFREQLAAAQAAPKPHRIIKVWLDAGLSERRDALMAQIAEASKPPKDPRFAKKKPAVDALKAELGEFEAAEADSMVELRVEKAPGTEFSIMIGRYPATTQSDLRIGYNIRGMVDAEGHKWVTRREGDEWVPFEFSLPVKARSGAKAVPGVNEFADLCAVLSGADVELISDAVFELNHLEPSKRRERLGKASTADPEPSASS